MLANLIFNRINDFVVYKVVQNSISRNKTFGFGKITNNYTTVNINLLLYSYLTSGYQNVSLI